MPFREAHTRLFVPLMIRISSMSYGTYRSRAANKMVVPSHFCVGIGKHKSPAVVSFILSSFLTLTSQTSPNHISTHNRPSIHRYQARSHITFVPQHRTLASYRTLRNSHMPSQTQLPRLIHFGLVYAAFYLLLSFVLGHYGVVFRAILAAVLACPTFLPREWIFLVFALQGQIVRETYRILDES